MTTTPSRPPFDPEIAAALTALGDEVVTGLAPDEIDELRRRVQPPDPAALTLGGTYTVTSYRVPVAWDASEATLVLVRPRAHPGPVPVLYHLHGGGMVTGSAHDDLPWLLELAAQTGTAVAAVEYRLAPEWQYPAAVEDGYAGLGWLAGHGAEHGIDPSRIVVCGVSAGGGLAAAIALLARDRGGPHLAGQLLIYPMLDDRNDTASAVQMAGVGAWDRAANGTGWGAYLGDRAGGPDVPGYAAPARVEDLAGLPPTFLDVGSAETFRDEDVAYASRLWACGGDAELHVWPGGCHGFDLLVPGASMSRDARAARVRWLTRILTRAVGSPPSPVAASDVVPVPTS
ncbi:MAG TPA: alpha/beta hydrolase [Cellulomonadaceae bacterium]|nr:alpha/beta hydrolase [Cellulomonadaceae bacterium]